MSSLPERAPPEPPPAEPAPTPASDRSRRPPGRALATLLFAATFGAVAAIGYFAYRSQVAARRDELQQQMQVVARLKADQIERWVRERQADVAGAGAGSRLAQEIERWRATGRLGAVEKGWVVARLERLREAGDYSDAVVLAPDGAPLLSNAGDAAGFAFEWRDLARAAIRDRAVLLAPLHRLGGREEAPSSLDVVGPLTVEDAAGARVVGALLFRVDPARFLFPLVQAWPTESASAESLLVERDGDVVHYLNALRHRRLARGDLRIPAGAADVVAAKALRGTRGVVEGVSYRGAPVLAAIEAVAGTQWLLVSEIERDEAYAPLRAFLRAYLAFLCGAALVALLAVRAWLRGEREAALRREHERTKAYVAALEAAEREREKLIASLTAALDDVKTLRGIVPICASCKRIRDDAGYWSAVETYVSKHTEAQFSHGICPECMKRLYPEYSG